MIRRAIFPEVLTSSEFFNFESTKLSFETLCSTIKKKEKSTLFQKYNRSQTAKDILLTMLLRKDTIERENIKFRMCLEVKKIPFCLRLFDYIGYI